MSDKSGHPDSMYPSNNDLPSDKTNLSIGDSIVGKPKRSTQKSPVLPLQNGTNNIGKRKANNMVNTSKGDVKGDALQSKHPSQEPFILFQTLLILITY